MNKQNNNNLLKPGKLSKLKEMCLYLCHFSFHRRLRRDVVGGFTALKGCESYLIIRVTLLGKKRIM